MVMSAVMMRGSNEGREIEAAGSMVAMGSSTYGSGARGRGSETIYSMGVEGFTRLPKIELHCHLDGCVRLESARDIAERRGVPLPSNMADALIAPSLCDDLADYI